MIGSPATTTATDTYRNGREREGDTRKERRKERRKEGMKEGKERKRTMIPLTITM